MSSEPPRTLLFPEQMELNCMIMEAHETTAAGLDRLFRTVPAGQFLGLAGAYDESRKMEYLAMATLQQVVIIRLIANEKLSSTKSKKRDPTAVIKNLTNILNDKLGTGSTHRFLAFDADRIAIALHHDFGVRIKGLVHLQTLTQSKKTAPSKFSAIFSLFKRGGFKEDDRIDVEDAFDDRSSIRAFEKRLQFRSTSAAFMSKLHAQAVEEAIASDYVIDTSTVPDATLSVLTSAGRTGDRLGMKRPSYIRNDFSAATIDERGTEIAVTLDRYSTRTRVMDDQVTVVETVNAKGKKRQITARTVEVVGRNATLNITTPMHKGLDTGNEVVSIATVGREPLTSGEERLRSLVMRGLQGNVNDLLDASPLLRLIWGESKETRGGSGATRRPAASTSRSALSDGINKMPPSVTASLNDSQKSAIASFCRDESSPSDPLVRMVQGPPGSGKTTMIAAMVQWLCTSHKSKLSKPPRKCYLVAQSNVGVKNMAEKLESVGFTNYRLIVSTEFREEWHDHLYERIQEKVIGTLELSHSYNECKKFFGFSSVILCTLSIFSHPILSQRHVTEILPPEVLIVDEASQIDYYKYITPFREFSTTLSKVCFVGDDKQLPPHGDIDSLKSIFDVKYLRQDASFLDTQYRMPVPIGEFISSEVYEGRLKSHHGIKSPKCVQFIDVPDGEEDLSSGRSFVNTKEIQAIIHCARQLRNDGKDYSILTGYDAQRNEIEKALKTEELPWKEIVFNVDSFQGNEADFILISLVRTNKVGFLADDRRVNVMLSRCKVGMVIIGNKDFFTEDAAAKKTLVSKMAEALDSEWRSWKDIALGQRIFETQDITKEALPAPDPATTNATGVPQHLNSPTALSIPPTSSEEVSGRHNYSFLPEGDVSFSALRFVDVAQSRQIPQGPEYTNGLEVDSVIALARLFEYDWKQFKILALYESQREMIKRALDNARMSFDENVFTAESFQDRQDDFIIISLVHTNFDALLKDSNLVRLMLSRGKEGTVVVTNRRLLMEDEEMQSSLIAQVAHEHEDRWLSSTDLVAGLQLFAPEENQNLSSRDVPAVEEPITAEEGEVFEAPQFDAPPRPLRRSPGPRLPAKSPPRTQQASSMQPPFRETAGPSAIARHISDPAFSRHGVSPAAAPFAYSEPFPSSISVSLGEAQRDAVASFCSGSPTPSVPTVSVVRGPPGSGKTQMITAMVQWLSNVESAEVTCSYTVCRSENGARTIVSGLQAGGFLNFIVVVADGTSLDWPEDLQNQLIELSAVPRNINKLKSFLGTACVLVCSLSSLGHLSSNKALQTIFPPQAIIIDDAGEIPVAALHDPIDFFRHSLSRICFLGNEHQRAPRGENNTPLKTIFGLEHLSRNAFFLPSQYRMPREITKFFSDELYEGRLQYSETTTEVEDVAVEFIDVSDGQQLEVGYSLSNVLEAEAVLATALRLENEGKFYTIITTYEGQKAYIEQRLEEMNIYRSGLVRIPETCGGFENDFIILSLVQTASPGFLSEPGQANMLLSRCRIKMIVIANRSFLMEDPIAKTTILSRMGASWSDRWTSFDFTPIAQEENVDDPNKSYPDYAPDDYNYQGSWADDVPASLSHEGQFAHGADEPSVPEAEDPTAWPDDVQPTW